VYRGAPGPRGVGTAARRCKWEGGRPRSYEGLAGVVEVFPVTPSCIGVVPIAAPGARKMTTIVLTLVRNC